MRSAEIPKRTPDDPPPGTLRFTQDFNTNFLRTSNSGTARSELVNVSENRVCESRRQQDPNPPAEAPESSESRNQKRRRLEIQSDPNWDSDCPTSRQDLDWPEKVAGENSVLKSRAVAAGGAGPQGPAEQATWKTEISPRRAGARSVNSARWP